VILLPASPVRARDDTTLFEVDLLLGEQLVRHTYGFELSDERVEAEWLHAYPHGRKQVWFDREADREHGEEFSFPGDGLRGGKERLAEFTRPNSLFLTVAASLNHPQLSGIHRWFLSNLWTVAPGDDIAQRGEYTRRMLTDARGKDKHQKQVEALLRVADLGVVGLRVDPSLAAEQQVRLLHHSGTSEPVPLDFARQESLGTFAWFSFLGPLLNVLDRGSVLLVDELDASLHPMLAGEVIRLFQDPAANPRSAQLIFTTHDATLLGTSMVDRPLDRDQVWITTKRRTGETVSWPGGCAGAGGGGMSRRRRSDPNAERHVHRGPAPTWRGNRVFYVAGTIDSHGGSGGSLRVRSVGASTPYATTPTLTNLRTAWSVHRNQTFAKVSAKIRSINYQFGLWG
jgi:AAA domain, putative AbiEii toxin, Type IV TA system